MTNTNTFNHLRPTTLAQLAAEIVIDHAEDLGRGHDWAFNFKTEAAKNAYCEILESGINHTGNDQFFTLLDEAISREWEAWNDKMFS